jgi:threonine aldolase
VEGLAIVPPQTNILFVDMVGPTRARCADLVAFLEKHGVRSSSRLPLRFVTHLDVDAAGIDRAAGLIRSFLAA